MSIAGRQIAISRAIVPALASPLIFGALFGFPGGMGSAPRFARTYSASKPVHLGITGRCGDITINSWSKREVNVKALSASPVEIDDRVTGSTINVKVGRPHMRRVDFDIYVPGDTSISVNSTMGRVAISGVNGHISIDTVNGDIHLMDVRSSCVEAKTLMGDIHFDGELAGDGPYTLQSMSGDIDVILPDSVSFDLVARSLASSINLGGFFLSQRSEQDRSISGKHERGGPRLNLTTFEGRILLHKK
jgi:DUF4097 and DUF4098 domain-containing protein YvlB